MPSQREMETQLDANRFRQELKLAEAALCAIVTELKGDKDLFDKIISNAERNGEVKISSIILKHLGEDRERLSSDMEKYSNHERSMILQILQGV